MQLCMRVVVKTIRMLCSSFHFITVNCQLLVSLLLQDFYCTILAYIVKFVIFETLCVYVYGY